MLKPAFGMFPILSPIICRLPPCISRICCLYIDIKSSSSLLVLNSLSLLSFSVMTSALRVFGFGGGGGGWLKRLLLPRRERSCCLLFLFRDDLSELLSYLDSARFLAWLPLLLSRCGGGGGGRDSERRLFLGDLPPPLPPPPLNSWLRLRLDDDESSRLFLARTPPPSRDWFRVCSVALSIRVTVTLADRPGR